MKGKIRWAVMAILLITSDLDAREAKSPAFQKVPDLGYRVVPEFFHFSEDMKVGEAFQVYRSPLTVRRR
jgi:hypothetical protein